jgi:hypothetical protein
MCEASLLADLTATAVPPLEESLAVFKSALPWASDTDTEVPPVDLASALASASKVRVRASVRTARQKLAGQQSQCDNGQTRLQYIHVLQTGMHWLIWATALAGREICTEEFVLVCACAAHQ